MRHQNGSLHGNLALQYVPESASSQSTARKPQSANPEKPALEPSRLDERFVSERKRQIRRELTVRRIRDLVLILSAVFVVSGIFGLMVWRQSRILADNFANLSIERQIKRLDESSSQISENLAVHTELGQIRTQAIQRLGLQVPARSQIVPVVIPNTDRVVFNDIAMATPGDDSYLMGLLFNLEGFFKTLDVKGSN